MNKYRVQDLEPDDMVDFGTGQEVVDAVRLIEDGHVELTFVGCGSRTFPWDTVFMVANR